MSPADSWPYPGARWWKFDFHTHTPASKDTYWAKSGDMVTPRAWLLRFMEAGLDCVAITDHNTGGWIGQLQAAYSELQAEQPDGFRELHLFPGVELSVNGGFHLLALFDLNASRGVIDELRGAAGSRATEGESDGVTEKSAVEVIRIVRDLGGLPIPAHVDGPKGLLELEGEGTARSAIDPGALRQVCMDRTVLAAEVLDRSKRKPQIYDEAGCRWTAVLGSDCHSFQAPAPGTRFTWVKMARPSLAGLQLALHDGDDFSVRRSDAPDGSTPNVVPAHLIEAIEISDARYMGRGKPARLALSPWLNALVGGRGTGKSTVVHALRLAYRLELELEKLNPENEARLTFERFRKEPASRQEHGALSYAKDRRTEIVLSIRRDGVPYRVRWRQDGAGSVVEEQGDGGWKAAGSQAVTTERFPVRIFSQGQIAALAGESQEALLHVIDQSGNAGPAKAALDEAERRFFALRAQLREVETRLRAKEPVQLQADDVGRKLAAFEGKEHAAVLKEFQVRSRQSREVERQLAAARTLSERLQVTAGEVVPEAVPPGLFAGTEIDRSATEALARLHAELQRSAEAVAAAASSLAAAAAAAQGELAASGWDLEVKRGREAYDALVVELRQRGVGDPSEYGKLVQERQRLEGDLARMVELDGQRVKLLEELRTQHGAVRMARQRISLSRSRFLSETLAGNKFVRIEVERYGRDALVIAESLRAALDLAGATFSDLILELDDSATPKRGIAKELLDGLPADPSAAAAEMEGRLDVLGARFERAASGKMEFPARFNSYVQRLATERPDRLDRLLVWNPLDSLIVEYSGKGDGNDFRPIGQASAGQRAAAMLALLLAHGDEPLVLDQPEDDLDNHLIYDLVVRHIRERKLRRQLVIVTHNPNIVVNGDAELVHALDFQAGQCVVGLSGSLQEQSIRDEVCRVMEGGREAFERRYHRLAKDG